MLERWAKMGYNICLTNGRDDAETVHEGRRRRPRYAVRDAPEPLVLDQGHQHILGV